MPDPSSRAAVLTAILEIVDDRGLDSVSFREVAAAAGVSIGTVQYYCRSKDEMLRAAYEHIAERLAARVVAVAAPTVREHIDLVARELLPLDPERTAESRVYLAFAARAATSPSLRAVQHRILGSLRDGLVDAFAHAVAEGSARPDLDPRVAAVTTAALVDGLLLHRLTDPDEVTPATVTDALDAHLSGLLPIE
ncbi:TetR/AcrR family transcriptional regulator [Gordonia humi]|uniref:AcrR family transcriptional regulator n=1 Tax=Gordonia humi TaxID=686429 RepID=A0A840F917_9ACTN|nr:TetR family transcriptional regulator C-terminal domain-containing protein [Gordonia humi]MBB4136650.1 AcrR family transcriptional regulator [Gordonia humi]